MGTVDILLPPLCSEEECPPRRLTSKCSMSRTRTLLTSSSGSQTTSNLLFAISHQRDSRWPLPSLVTPPPSRKCSRELVSNSLLCSEERHSSIGTPVKAWTRWSSLRPSPTNDLVSEYQQYQDAGVEDEEEMDEEEMELSFSNLT